jgi:hypothetical protein
MKKLLIKIGVIGIVIVFGIISFNFSVQAEKKKFKDTLIGQQIISKTTVSPGDFPNHELTQQVSLRLPEHYKTQDPDLKEAWVYEQLDSIAGSGSHRGRWIGTDKDGDKFYAQFEGTHKTVVREDGSWETTWEGKCQWTGGAGKYKNIKGSGNYKGKATPKSFIHEDEGEMEY